MKIAIVVIWSMIMGIVVSLPIEIPYKLVILLLPVVFIFFALRPFLALMALLLFRPELELFSESGFLKYFSVIPLIFLFIFIGIKKFDFCLKKLKFLYFFIFICLLSFIFSINLEESLIHILRLLGIVAIYLITFNLIETKEDAMRLLYCFPLAMIIPLIVGFNQFIMGETYVTPATQMERVEGLFVLANSFARFLFVGLFASIPLFYYAKKRKIFLSALVVVSITTIILLKVRSVILGLIVAFLLLSYLTPKIRKHLWIIIPTLALLMIPLSLLLFENLLNPDTTKVYGGETFFWRQELWDQLFNNAFLKKPIFGFGVGTSSKVSYLYTTFLNLPHNDYLRILIENGILGLIFYLLFFSSNLWSSYKEIKIKENKYFNIIALILIFSFIFMSSAANVFYAVTYFWYFFTFLAITHKLNTIAYNSLNLQRNGKS